jgi:hypothetical protein
MTPAPNTPTFRILLIFGLRFCTLPGCAQIMPSDKENLDFAKIRCLYKNTI